MKAGACRICDDLEPVELISLDAIMADPRQWPANIWGKFPVPKGVLPARVRRLGAVGMGLGFLEARRFPASRSLVARHYAHIPQLLVDQTELIAAGIIEAGPRPTAPDLPIDPGAYVRYYDRGIKLGILGVTKLEEMVQSFEDTGEEVPFELIKLLIDVGSKLATSQAAITARGKFDPNEDPSDEGFRKAGEPEASPRFGDHRIRTIAGERRPVVDRGQKDRAKYNERAALEGSPKLPA